MYENASRHPSLPDKSAERLLVACGIALWVVIGTFAISTTVEMAAFVAPAHIPASTLSIAEIA